MSKLQETVDIYKKLKAEWSKRPCDLNKCGGYLSTLKVNFSISIKPVRQLFFDENWDFIFFFEIPSKLALSNILHNTDRRFISSYLTCNFNQVSLTQLSFLPTSNTSASTPELILARDILELGAQWSILKKDIPSFERYIFSVISLSQG